MSVFLALCFLSQLSQGPSSWLTPDPASVHVRLLWDVLIPDPNSCPPLYVLWRVHSELGLDVGVKGLGSSPKEFGDPGELPFLSSRPDPTAGGVARPSTLLS